MPRYVDVDKLLEKSRYVSTRSDSVFKVVRVSDIEKMPIETSVNEHKTAKLVDFDKCRMMMSWKCGNCGHYVNLWTAERPYNYCPMCGSKFDKYEIEED